jgi:hypothetical protein
MTATTATAETTTTDAPAATYTTVTAWKNIWGGDDGLRYMGRQVVASRVVTTEAEFMEAWEELGTYWETSYRAARPADDRWDTDKNLYY